MKLTRLLFLVTLLATGFGLASENEKNRPLKQKNSPSVNHWDSNVWEKNSAFKFWRTKQDSKPRMSKAARRAPANSSAKHSSDECTAACRHGN
ncbi:MAG: hypothetical protein WD342_19600 [Verrucomicrobiales bacterium]